MRELHLQIKLDLSRAPQPSATCVLALQCAVNCRTSAQCSVTADTQVCCDLCAESTHGAPSRLSQARLSGVSSPAELSRLSHSQSHSQHSGMRSPSLRSTHTSVSNHSDSPLCPREWSSLVASCMLGRRRVWRVHTSKTQLYSEVLGTRTGCRDPRALIVD